MGMFQFKEAPTDLEKARDFSLELGPKQKLWVPNCFLQEPLQKKYNCDYVLFC